MTKRFIIVWSPDGIILKVHEDVATFMHLTAGQRFSAEQAKRYRDVLLTNMEYSRTEKAKEASHGL